MIEDKSYWTSNEVFREVFRNIINQIREEAALEVTLRTFQDALSKQDTLDFEDALVEKQLVPLYYLMLYLDRASSPSGSSTWPGIQLVNAQTREPLSSDYGMELAGVIRETLYID